MLNHAEMRKSLIRLARTKSHKLVQYTLPTTHRTCRVINDMLFSKQGKVIRGSARRHPDEHYSCAPGTIIMQIQASEDVHVHTSMIMQLGFRRFAQIDMNATHATPITQTYPRVLTSRVDRCRTNRFYYFHDM